MELQPFNLIDRAIRYAVIESIKVPAVPFRCADSAKESVVNVVLGRPACAVKGECFHTCFSRPNDTRLNQASMTTTDTVETLVARAGFAPASRGYEPLVLSHRIHRATNLT
jgi:hypothetical protein